MMNPWVILGFVVAIIGAAGAGYYQGNEAGQAKVQQAWDKEKAAQYAEYAKGQEAARQKEQELQASADSLRKEKDREIRDLNARAVALSNSLRDRPSRPTTESSSVPGAAGVGCPAQACTGAGLSREDAEFLSREAARGDELRALLKQCHAQYETLRRGNP